MSALYTEITTDPLNLGYAPLIAVRNDAAVASILQSKNYTKPGWISITDFNSWCALHSAEYANITALAANSTSPYYGTANALLRVLNGANSEGAFNLADANIITMFDIWPFVDTTGAAKAALVTMGTSPASRADVLGIDGSANAVSLALNTLGAE